jgi:hypothetical protein
MPSPKRWFPVSHDIFDDPELWAFIDRFGHRAILTPFYIFSQIDRKENQLPLVGDWLRSTARRLRQTPRSIAEQLVWLLANDWLSAGGYLAEYWRISGQVLADTWLDTGRCVADNSPIILSARNYWKFHKRRETTGVHKEPSKAPPYPNRSEPNLSSPPIAPPSPDPLYPKELKRQRASMNGHTIKPNPRFEEFWHLYPARGGKKVEQGATRERFEKLSADDQVLCCTAAKHYAQWLTGSNLNPKDPKRFLFDGKGVEYWRDHIDAPKLTNGNGQHRPPPFPPKTDPIARGQWRNAYGNPRDYGYE